DRVDLRQTLDPGREVGAEFASPVLRARVVGVALLEHAETETHQRAARDLALDERRVDRPADVETRPEVLDPDLARLVVDLDLGCAGRVRDGRVGWAVDAARLRVDDRRVRLQLGARAGDQLAVRPGRGCRNVGNADLLLRRALRDYLAVDHVQVLGRDLELLRGDLEQLRAGVRGRFQDGVPGDERRAGREGAGADGRRVGVRVVVGDPVV